MEISKQQVDQQGRLKKEAAEFIKQAAEKMNPVGNLKRNYINSDFQLRVD